MSSLSAVHMTAVKPFPVLVSLDNPGSSSAGCTKRLEWLVEQIIQVTLTFGRCLALQPDIKAKIPKYSQQDSVRFC